MRAACLVACCALVAVGVGPALGQLCVPGQNAQHEECGAGPIHAGAVTREEQGAVYEGHWTTFVRNYDSDDDCCMIEGTWDEQGEDEFSCEWYIQRLFNEVWEDAPFGGWEVWGCVMASWCSAGAPPGTYRAKVIVDDTPEEGQADGDDGWVEVYSDSFEVVAPTVARVWVEEVFCNEPEPGAVMLFYRWTSTCGHTEDLDNVTIRSRCTYDGADNPHDLSHDGQNSFNERWPNPGAWQGFGGDAGEVPDWEPRPYVCGRCDADKPLPHPRASTCVATRHFEQAYKYPTAPAEDDPTVAWTSLESFTIGRSVVLAPGSRWYMVWVDPYEYEPFYWECWMDPW